MPHRELEPSLQQFAEFLGYRGRTIRTLQALYGFGRGRRSSK
jgi:hypothetical protein